MAVLKGIVINGKIVLKEPLVLPEGVEVEIIPPAKYRILKHAGIWKNLDNVDMLIKEIYDSRTIALPNSIGTHPIFWHYRTHLLEFVSRG